MLTTELKHEIEKFDIQRQKDVSHFVRLKELQQGFVSDFQINDILSLKLDDYIEGKGSQTSFCYRLERQLGEIGDMRGSTVAVFVVYYSKNKSDYLFTKILGEPIDEYDALTKVKEEIVKLISAGKERNHKAIINNRLSDLFKYKILGTYYPDEYLNLYSHRHLNYFIGELDLKPKGKTVLEKQNILLEFKNSNELMKVWSNYEFNSFLYTNFGRPPSNDDEEVAQGALPPIEKVKPVLINLVIGQAPDSNPKKNKGAAKPNYKEQQERNDKLGKRGENIVYNLEKEFITSNGFNKDLLIHSSKDDDRLGYDIKSVDESGNTKYIEVKATRRKKGDTNFIITENEVDKAEKLENYYIYIVFEAHTTRPEIWQIKEPFKNHKDEFNLTPINYRVSISVEE